MRARNTLTLLILAAVAIAATAQEATPIPTSPWQLLIYPTAEGISTTEVAGSMERGFVPVGLEIESAAETVLLMRRVDGLRVAGWTITRHEDLSALEEDFASVLAQGFLPMDITSHGGGLSILWIATDRTIEGWRIHASARDADSISAALDSFEDDGFSLWGVSDDPERVWYLFVRWADIEQQGALTFLPGTSEALRAGIESARSEGWLANGIAIQGGVYLMAFSR